MKAKSLFGTQFVQLPVFKTRILDEFESWKVEKQRFYDKQNQNYHFLLYLMLRTRDEHPDWNWDQVRRSVRLDLCNVQDIKLPPEVLADITRRTNYCDIEPFEVEQLLKEENCKHYYITNSVLSECVRLKCKEPFDVAWLEPIPDGKRQLSFGSYMLRMEKKGTKIIVLSAHHTDRQENNYLEYTFFNFDLVEKTQSHSLLYDTVDDLHYEISSKTFDSMSRKLFFRLLTFIVLAPVEEIFLPAGRKHGNKKTAGGLVNETAFPFTVIDARWNRAIHVGKITVEPFYRLQPHGAGNKLRKLMYIDQFFRDGYNLKPKKKSTF